MEEAPVGTKEVTTQSTNQCYETNNNFVQAKTISYRTREDIIDIAKQQNQPTIISSVAEIMLQILQVLIYGNFFTKIIGCVHA